MEDNQTMRPTMKSSYGEDKADKSMELNDTMSIKETPRDEYTNKINNIGGNAND